CEELQNKYQNITIVFSPEFLTQRNHLNDSITPSRIIIGGENKEAVKRVEELFRHRFGNSTLIYTTGWREASLVKYGANCFFAMKISYFNFIYSICQKLELNFNDVKDMILSDGRISRSHADVPGWDKQLGFGGHCFIKDINAFIEFSKVMGLEPELLEASWSQNQKDRSNRDWESLGSSVISYKDKK
ncbi:MAG TPA: hypothetical protein VFV86_11440, partial [Nitrososphaeraceae archaeon]|nr:hypothetical protein [Nitrososphaeraceae archaeon]